MSLAVRKAGPLKPEIRLAQAISEFEASLSDSGKARFRAHRSQVPGINDVMRLTAEIDRNVKASRRTWGPRFTSFLEGLQKFASIGDIVIGASPSFLAKGVWTVARFSLLALTEHISYMDQLSAMFMDLGRSVPRYQNMVTIWPESETLRLFLEYLIVVTELCHHILDVCSQSLLSRLSSTLLKDTKPFKSKLELLAASIRQEMQLQASRVIKSEVEDNKKFKLFARSHMELSRKTQLLLQKQDVLDKLSRYDHQAPWKQIRRCGNVTVLQSSVQYVQWLAHAGPANLFYTGKLGSGKSVLLASMVDDLVLLQKQATIAYFFCRHDICVSLQPGIIFGSLARQIMEQQYRDDWTSHDLGLRSDELNISTFDIETCLRILDSCVSGKIIIVLDGLDECSEHEARCLIETLSLLQSRRPIFICYSFRQNPYTSFTSKRLVKHASFQACMPSDNPDISAFIDAEIDTLVADGDLVISSELVRSIIKHTLSIESQGMFLWVILQIKSLCLLQTDHAILEALKDLPRDLPGIYRRLLRLAEERFQKGLQRQIFEWVVEVRRPLTTEELREALSIEIGDVDFEPLKLINNVHRALGSCTGLVIVDEEESTVRLVHPSVRKFLLSKDEANASWAVNQIEASINTTTCILTYLNFQSFRTELVQIKGAPGEMASMPKHMLDSVTRSAGLTGRVVSNLLKRSETTDQKSNPSKGYDMMCALENRERGKRACTPCYSFRDYALSHWSLHLASIRELNGSMQKLLSQLIRGRKVDLNEGNEAAKEMPWNAAVAEDNTIMIEILYKSLAEMQCLQSSSAFIALRHAVESGNIGLLDKLLKLYNPGQCIQDRSQKTLLSHACLSGQIKAVECLLDASTDSTSRSFLAKLADKDGFTPLDIAASKGYTDIVRILHSWDADSFLVNGKIKRSIIILPVEGRHLETLKLIISILQSTYGHDDKEFVGHIEEAIRCANDRFYGAIIRYLFCEVLTAPNPKLAKDCLRSVFYITPMDNFKAVLEVCYASSKLQSVVYDNFLFTAISHPDTELQAQAKALLETVPINPYQTDSNNHTHLMCAAARNRNVMVKMLLNVKGVDINCTDNCGRTALDIARQNGHEEVVRTLEKYIATGSVEALSICDRKSARNEKT